MYHRICYNIDDKLTEEAKIEHEYKAIILWLVIQDIDRWIRESN